MLAESNLEQPPIAATRGSLTRRICKSRTYGNSAEPNFHSSPLDTADSDLYGMPCYPIPQLPPRPEYPASQIDDKMLRDYMVPLYSRKWAIIYGFKWAVGNKSVWYKTPLVAKTFEFPTFEATMDFVTEVARLAQAEDVSTSSEISDIIYYAHGLFCSTIRTLHLRRHERTSSPTPNLRSAKLLKVLAGTCLSANYQVSHCATSALPS